MSQNATTTCQTGTWKNFKYCEKSLDNLKTMWYISRPFAGVRGCGNISKDGFVVKPFGRYLQIFEAHLPTNVKTIGNFIKK
jgi:hypothetical protein